MAEGFKSGSAQIPQGVLNFSVSGISFDFTPVRVTVAVRAPDAESDFITAGVVGAIRSDGFDVALSSPVSADGYLLDWTAFSAGVSPSPVAGDSLQVSYNDLKAAVARFLGYNPSGLTTTQATEVDLYIQSGVRNFYYPPALQGVDPDFEWSFLKMAGTLALSKDVNTYLLPDGFGRIFGQIYFSDSEARESVPVVPYGDVVQMLAAHASERGRPRFAAEVFSSAFGSRGHRKQIIFFPTPDKAYSVTIRGDADNGKLDAVNRVYPLGGPMFSELITESCLAVAEQRANDEMGLHTQNFNTLLVSMIQRDRKTGAQNFGRMGGEKIW